MSADKKQPWIKFYPADWRADPKLRMCGLAARGLWIEMLGLMHEAVPYGHLLVNAVSPSPKQIGAFIGVPEREVNRLLAELEQADVFSRTGAGVIYSRRMVRDKTKAERDRENGKGGGNPRLREGVNPNANGDDKAQRLDTRSPEARGKKEQAWPPGFEDFWTAFPPGRKNSKGGAARVYERVLKAGVATADELLGGAMRYRAAVGEHYEFVSGPEPWLNKRRWLDENPAGPERGAGKNALMAEFDDMRQEYSEAAE